MAMNSFKKIIMMENQAPKKHNGVFWNQQARIEEFSYNDYNSVCFYDSDINGYSIYPIACDKPLYFYVKNDYVYGEVHKKLIIFDYNIDGSGTVRLSVRTCDSNGNIIGSNELNSSLAGIGTNTTFLTTGYIGTTDNYSFSQFGVYNNDIDDYCNSRTVTITNIRCYDLTLMFGAGNEPSTVEEFYQRINGIPIDDLNAYNSGQWVEWDTP